MNRPHGAEIVAAWAEHCSGPGWSNDLIWVLWCKTAVGPQFGELVLDAIQPDDQTPEMRALFAVSSAASQSMAQLVMRMERQRSLDAAEEKK